MSRRLPVPFLRDPSKWRKRVLRPFLTVIVLFGAWFFAVDFSWFVEACDDCLSQKDVFQLRVLGWTVYSWDQRHDSFFKVAAAEVGVPCPHMRCYRWHKHRYWGLCVCAHPCINGVSLMTGDESDWPAFLDEFHAMVDEDPSLPAEYYRRVLMEHDYDYGRQLFDEIRCRLDVRAEHSLEER